MAVDPEYKCPYCNHSAFYMNPLRREGLLVIDGWVSKSVECDQYTLYQDLTGNMLQLVDPDNPESAGIPL